MSSARASGARPPARRLRRRSLGARRVPERTHVLDGVDDGRDDARADPARARRLAAFRRWPLRRSHGGTNSPLHTPRRAAFAAATWSTYAVEYRLQDIAQPSRTRQALTSSPSRRQTATMRPYRSRSRSSHATERPSMGPASARVACSPHGQRRLPARQLWALSGASTPNGRIRAEPTSIVSPSITRARPAGSD